MVKQIEIPTLPIAQIRAMSLVGNPNPSFEELAAIVESDPGLTAALLRAANSAASAPVAPVHTSRIAMVRIGTSESRRLVMSIALSSAFGSLTGSHIDENEMWRHVVATGLLADAITWGEIKHSEAFTAGLLPDLGRIARAAQDPERYAIVVDRAREGVPALDGERDIFGMDHCHWGESIGRAWGFPEEIVQAIGGHHAGVRTDLSWAVARAREVSATLNIGDGLVAPTPPPPGSESAMLPVLEELGGEEAFFAHVDWYSGSLRAS